MRNQTSSEFEAYARTLRRVFWSEFIDRQMALEAPSAPAGSTSSQPTLAVYPLPAKASTPRR